MNKSNLSVKISCFGGNFAACHFIIFENGECEPLHGHNFSAAVTVSGPLNEAGYVIDFLLVDRELKALLEDWNQRTIFAVLNPNVSIQTVGNQVEATYTSPDGSKLYWSLPKQHCVLLDISNATTELLAQTMAEKLWSRLSAAAPLTKLKLRLSELQGSCAQFTIYSPDK